jgi:PfaB family protein
MVNAVVVGWISHERQSAAALVLRRRQDVQAANARCYAVIDSVASTDQSGSLSPQDIAGAISLAATSPQDIAYVEIVGNLSANQAALLENAYRQPGEVLTCALGSEDDLSLIPALVKVCLCIHHRFLPASPQVPVLTDGKRSIGAPFYLVQESRTWFQPQASGARQAAVYTGASHFTLSESITQSSRPNQALQNSDLRLYPVAGDSREELLQGLSTLKDALLSDDDPCQVALNTFEKYRQRPDAPYAAALMGRDREDTLRELEYALKGVPAAFEKGVDWQTPLGSTFSPSPVGRQGPVAFVYPGAFNSYVGLGKDLFYLFPHLHERFGEVSTDIGSVICEELVYPRSQGRLDEAASSVLEARLTDDPIAMLKSGTTLSTLYTMILRDIFQVEPWAAFGYSLGENSMMFAMGVWTNGDDASRRLSVSEVFRTRLSGPQNAVREYWGLSAIEDRGPLWRNYLLMASPERVFAAIQGGPRVYLTHINTPRQVVIGGEPDACQRVIHSLNCAHLQAPFNHALHNEAMQSELRGLVDLHNSPVVTVPHTRLYSAAAYQPLAIEQDEIAQKIGQMLCSSLDFPRLVEQVYAGGARLFIELGAGSNCAKWVDETLQARPHASIGINRRGVDDLTSIVRVLAKLCTHRAGVNLAPLYFPPAVTEISMREKFLSNVINEA